MACSIEGNAVQVYVTYFYKNRPSEQSYGIQNNTCHSISSASVLEVGIK